MRRFHMIRNINLSEAFLYNLKMRTEHAKQYQLTQKNIEKIQKIALRKIQYPDFKESYDYADNLFPRAKAKDAIIYKVASKDLEKMGYGEAGGFYDSVTKIIVIAGVRHASPNIDKRYFISVKVSNDEVIVHELCHYCYVSLGRSSVSMEMQEEFAYGWSVGYLRQKGYSDEYIIKYNFLPYFMKVCYPSATKKILAQNGISNAQYNSFSRFKKKEFDKTYGKKIFLIAKEMGIEYGWKLIKLYKNKENVNMKSTEIDEENSSRYNILDFG